MTDSDQARFPGFPGSDRLPRLLGTTQWLYWQSLLIGITVAGQQRLFTTFPFPDFKSYKINISDFSR